MFVLFFLLLLLPNLGHVSIFNVTFRHPKYHWKRLCLVESTRNWSKWIWRARFTLHDTEHKPHSSMRANSHAKSPKIINFAFAHVQWFEYFEHSHKHTESCECRCTCVQCCRKISCLSPHRCFFPFCFVRNSPIRSTYIGFVFAPNGKSLFVWTRIVCRYRADGIIPHTKQRSCSVDCVYPAIVADWLLTARHFC